MTTDDGLTVTSSTETAEQITESLKPEPAAEETTEEQPHPKDPKLSKAASKLGKAGGEATAAKRAEAQEAEAEGTSEAEAAKKRTADEIAKAGRGQKKQLASERVEEATLEAAEIKRQLKAERAERERLAGELARERAAKAKPAEEHPKAAADPEPKAEDFDSYEQYVKAAARWEARQEWNERQKVSAEEARVAASHQNITKAVESFQGRMDEHAKADPTIKERTAALAASLQPSFTLAKDQQLGPLNVIADEIIRSEQAPTLMLHLAEHQDDLQRIASLRTPWEISREMAKLETRLEVATPGTPTPKPEVSQARPPVRPVTGSPHTANAEPDPDSSSFDEHLRFYNAKERRAR